MSQAENLEGENQFSEQEKEMVIALSYRLTGSNLVTSSKINSCLVNTQRRMQATNAATLQEYLAKVESSSDELGHFIPLQFTLRVGLERCLTLRVSSVLQIVLSRVLLAIAGKLRFVFSLLGVRRVKKHILLH